MAGWLQDELSQKGLGIKEARPTRGSGGLSRIHQL